MKLRCLIIDDELNCRNNLDILIRENCPSLDVVGVAESAALGREMVSKHNPHVVFLDIKMPREDGFAFLKSLPDRNFSVVFTTAHNEYALKAFKAKAVDYITKPIDPDDLEQAESKLLAVHSSGQDQVKTNNEIIQQLIKDGIGGMEDEKTTIPTRDGFAIVRSKDIIHLEASDSYTVIYLTEGRKFVSSKNIKVYEKRLNDHMFFRTHKSHIINVAFHLNEFSRSQGNIAVLSNNVQVPISRRKLPDFLHRIGSIG